MRSKHTVYILVLLLSLAFCLPMSACGQTSGKVAGSAGQNQGKPADYIGLYQLTEHKGDAPFTVAEITEANSGHMYMYNGESLIADSRIDYSEQRALNGNPLMVVSFTANDRAGEIGISISFIEGQPELHMRGYDDLEDFEGTFEKIDGTMFLQSTDKAADYPLNKLQTVDSDLDETTVIEKNSNA